jgi:hypothetical protein
MREDIRKLFDQYVLTWRFVLQKALGWHEHDVNKFIDLWFRYASNECAPFFHRTPTFYVSEHITRRRYPKIIGFEIFAISRFIEKLLDFEIGAKCTTYPVIPTQENLARTNWGRVCMRIEQLFEAIDKKHAIGGKWDDEGWELAGLLRDRLKASLLRDRLKKEVQRDQVIFEEQVENENSNPNAIMIGLLQGKKDFELSNGSKVRIVQFNEKINGFPCSPTIECMGTARWTINLKGGGIPTISLPSYTIGLYACEIKDGILLIATDANAYAIAIHDGQITGSANMEFAFRNPLDYFEGLASPDGKHYAIISTQHIAVFSSNGAVVADRDSDGLITSCCWKSNNAIEYRLILLNEKDDDFTSVSCIMII